MADTPGLSRDLQLSLGKKIRESYSIFVQSLPLSLVALSRKIPNVPKSGGLRPSSASVTFENKSEGGFDPETVWADLAYLETNPATPGALSLCLIALLNNGERNASRLASKAVLKLIAPRVTLDP